MDCLPRWCCWTVLPDGVIQHNFSQKWFNFTCLWGWALEGIFSRGGGTSRFFQKFFYGGPKVMKFGSYYSKLRKQHCWWNFQTLAPLPTPICLCVGKVRATPLNNGENLGNFKPFNTISNSEILLNLIPQNEIFDRSILPVSLFLHWQS